MLEKEKYANGQIIYHLKDDVLTYFFKTGIKKAEGIYSNSLMEGEWKFYREKGQLWQIGNFERGIKQGKWVRYDKNGTLEYSEEFDKGKIKTRSGKN